RAQPWDPSSGTGGILAFLCKGALIVNGVISASGSGFVGGNLSGARGEGVGGQVYSGPGPLLNGGNGGFDPSVSYSGTANYEFGSGGGGGANAGAGGGGGSGIKYSWNITGHCIFCSSCGQLCSNLASSPCCDDGLGSPSSNGSGTGGAGGAPILYQST